ncbi:MAG: efflux RND transporter permease subunit [Gammaproteobacteria bacterium]|nr:efflux RND transporter permease subunit [Gammaproteobacteria bacterium]MYF29376.1 efflux RND transporter permease subunit [Gammaproteobacteria bacterium]MYK48633.1 efflux RND transporter permease subunit [Gammaproteobacteria bacterium]
MSAFESAAAFAVRRPVAVTVVAVAVALVGGLSWRELPVDLLPDLQSPTVVVSIQSGNRPPTEMERVYGQNVERMLTTVRGSRNVSQVARTGRLVTTVTFDWDADLDLALVDVQKAVGGIEGDPEVDEVVVRRFDPRQSPILTLGLVAPSGKPDLAELRQLARRQVAPALEQLAGVAEARVTGGRDIEIRVSADRYRLEAFGVSLNLLRGRVAAQNVDIEAGTLEEGDQVFQVRGVARYRNAQDVADVVVRYTTDPTGASKAVRVSDLATVEAVDAEIDHLVLVDGVEGVGVAVYKEAGANTVEVSAEVREALEGLGDDLPGVDVREIADDAKLVTDALDDLKIAAGAGVALAVLVLALFLRSAGATLIVTAAVPVSILAALFAMNFAEHSLNIVTLGGLALGAGMLVDNAIVVVESMYRRLGLGDSPDLAASRGTGQVAGAITASTLTTCVVFLPVLFVEGLAARLIDGIAFTVVVSLLASLAVAVFLIPALGRWFLPRASRSGMVTERAASRARTALQNFVGRLLKRPGTVVLLAIGIVAVAASFLLQLGTELLAPSDPRQFSVRIVGPAAQRVESTARAAASVENLIAQAGGGPAADGGALAATLSEVGRLPEDGRSIRTELTEENTARVIARMTSEGPTGRQVASWLGGELDTLPETEVQWEIARSALTDALGASGPPIVVEIAGESVDDLRRGADEIKARLAGIPALWNIKSSFEGGPRELRVTLDPAMADALGIDLNTVAQVLAANLDGLEVTRLSLGDEERVVNVRLPSPRREQLPDVEFLSGGGRPVALGEVARFEETEGAREIFRRDQRRVGQITAQLADGFTQAQAVAAVTAAIADAPIPPGTHVRLRGQEEERAQTFDELRLAGILALVLVLMVLAGTFESLLQPITVLAAVPLALVGVAVALVPGGQPIGVMAMLGLIVLSGIAVNDAVLLLATARQLMAEGQDRVSALAAAAGIRLRPIVMTTLTTALALAPLVLAGGEGAQLRAPMALTIIGGIVASTLGSLLVLPCLYLVLDRLAWNRGGDR